MRVSPIPCNLTFTVSREQIDRGHDQKSGLRELPCRREGARHMGLDQFICRSWKEPSAPVNGREPLSGTDESLMALRKYYDLHQWMRDLWEERGGESCQPAELSFNAGDCVELSELDLKTLKADIEGDRLPTVEPENAEINREYYEQEARRTLIAIKIALKIGTPRPGFDHAFIYYTSWW